MSRRKNDAYYTDAQERGHLVLKSALAKTPLREFAGSVFDPCAGDGAFLRALSWNKKIRWVTADIDPSLGTTITADMSQSSNWAIVRGSLFSGEEIPFTVMNPPFALIHDFFLGAISHSKTVIMLANLNWLEPVKNRKEIHSAYSPSQVIVLPRISYTGDGKTYFMTSAIFVYEKGGKGVIDWALI